MMEAQTMSSPPPMAESLDYIKDKYEGFGNPTAYRIVKIPLRYDGTMSVVCDTEIAWKYDDLCIKMFDLDISGWEISGGITSGVQNIVGYLYNVVTIRMTRNI